MLTSEVDFNSKRTLRMLSPAAATDSSETLINVNLTHLGEEAECRNLYTTLSDVWYFFQG